MESTRTTRIVKTTVREVPRSNDEEEDEQSTRSSITIQAPTVDSACGFCDNATSSYTCPRCQRPYCSAVCYKSASHVECAERFYAHCVDDEIGTREHEKEKSGEKGREKLKMMKMLKKDYEEGRRGEEEEEVDPDDQGEEDVDDTYVDLVDTLTRDVFKKATRGGKGDDYVDEEELDRQLLTRGNATDISSLLSSLSTSERRQFEQLCHDMDVEQEALVGRSVFQGGKQ